MMIDVIIIVKCFREMCYVDRVLTAE